MANKINFSDNIFYLTMWVKTLNSSLKLDIDRQLFQKSVTREIGFLAATIDEIYSLLKSNAVIIDRGENLKGIQRLKIQFNHLLAAILEGNTDLAQDHVGEYRKIQTRFREDIEEIRDIITGISEKSIEEKYTISEEEYRSLFAHED